MKIACPCCLGSGEIEEAAPVPLSPMQFRIFDIVRRSVHGIPGDLLVDRLYADHEDGGPLYARRSMWVQIKLANNRLAKANLRIATTTGGPRSPYSLQRLSS